jgi:hypothetical protein
MRNEKPKCSMLRVERSKQCRMQIAECGMKKAESSMLKVEWIVRSFESACLSRPRSGPGPAGSEFGGRKD